MIKYQIYKDKPIMLISDDVKVHRRISFGVNKAKLIISSIKEIEEFVKREDNKTLDAVKLT